MESDEHGASVQAALGVAARSAWRAGALPGTFRAAVVEASAQTDAYRRIAYRVQRQDVVLRLEHAHGSKKKDLSSIASPGSLDPWGVDAASLPGQTRALVTCPTCQGEKKVTCRVCVGQGRVRCGGCGGVGRVAGQRGSKNCPACRGRGDLKCEACTKGRVRCESCDALGRAYAWLEVQVGQYMQVRVHPRSGLAELHAGVDDVGDFDRVSAASTVPLVQDTGWIEPLVTELGPELAPQVQPRTDRVVGQRIQRFESVVHVFRYATSLGRGVVRVSGTAGKVLPDSDWRGLRRRAIAGVVAAVVLAIVGFVVVGSYVEQAAWFRDHGNGGAITLLALLAAVLGGVAFVGWLLPARGRTLWRARLPTLAFAAAWLGIAGLWRADGPTEDGVASALEAGELAEARTELEALRAVEGESAAASELLGQIEEVEATRVREQQARDDAAHLQRVQDSADVASALAALQGEWHDREIAARGRDVVVERARQDVDAAIAAGSTEWLERLAKIVTPLDAGLGAVAAERAHLTAAADAIEGKDFELAGKELDRWSPAAGDGAAQAVYDELRAELIRELAASIEAAVIDDADLGRRLSALDATLVSARLYERLAGEPAARSVVSLEKARDKTSAALEKQRAKAAAAEERTRKAEERKVQRAAKREAQRAAQRRAAAMSDRVQCCDGTYSPKCRHSQGSLRGCCSHHGGVC